MNPGPGAGRAGCVGHGRRGRRSVAAVDSRLCPGRIGQGDGNCACGGDCSREQNQSGTGHVRGGSSGRKSGKIELHQGLKRTRTPYTNKLLTSVVSNIAGKHVAILRQRDRLGQRDEWQQCRSEKYETSARPHLTSLEVLWCAPQVCSKCGESVMQSL